MRILFSLLLILSSVFSHAQNQSPGWEAITQGKFKVAEAAFKEVLKNDSTNKDALQGMVFLMEAREDDYHFSKYITTYTNNHWDEDFYLLFQSSYDGKTKDILKSPLNSRAKMDAILDSAWGEMRYGNDRKKSNALYRSVIQDFKWAYLGPFESPNGSGYAATYEAEKESFKTSKTYKSEYGEDRNWVLPVYAAPSGRALIYQHLTMNTSEPNVFFANTFINNPTKRVVQFRITRSAPIKIYLDDQLIYENRDIVPFMYDKEILELELEAGVHRILVKQASYFPISNANFNMNFKDYPQLEQDEFTLRITDKSGEALQDITSTLEANYTPKNYAGKVQVLQTSLTEAFEKRLAETNHPFYYYALNKAYLKEAAFKAGEERFVQLLRKNPNNLYFKFLAAKIYSAADKSEKVYATFSGTNYDDAPIFQMLWEKHSEIDLDNQEARFLSSVNKLLEITPANPRAINDKIKYFNKTGKEQEKDAFIDEVVKNFPVFKENLEEEKSTFKKKKDRESEDLKKKLAEQKAAVKNIKKQFDVSEYEKAIAYYKSKKDKKNTIALYNQLIAGRPHVLSPRIDKVKYLFDEGGYQEALRELDTCIGIKPILAQAYDLMGDIYYQMDQKPLALEAYQKTKAIRYSGGTNYYARDIDQKIEKISGRVSLKDIFKTPEFEDVLESPDWREMIEGEEALVLQYTKDMVLKRNNELEVYQKFMVAIINEAGARKWTSYNFDFMGNLQSYKLIKNDGTEIIPENTYNGLVFKNVEPGDLIQLEGTATMSIHDNFAQALLHRHFVFFEDPVFYSKFEVAIPSDMSLYSKVHKLPDTQEITVKGDFKHYNWTNTGLPAVRYEEAVVDQTDPYPNISISSLEDWSKTVRWYLGESYRKLDISYDVKEILDTLIKPEMTKEEQVRKLYNFVSGEIKYSFVPFYNSAYIPKDPTNTVSSLIGDCKDVATLMLTLLKELNIESYYTLVKTNQMDHLENIPSSNFDHVIVMYIIDGDTNYIDLTTDYFPMEVLPEMDCGANALVIKDGVTEDFYLPKMHLTPEKNMLHVKMTVNMKDDRSVESKMDINYKGVIAGMMRETLTKTPVNQQDDFLADRISDNIFNDLELTDYKFERLQNIESDLESRISFKANNFLDRVSNLYIFQMPYMVDIPATSVVSNKIRTNRIHLGQILETTPSKQEITITFPKGYQLTELPENISITHAYGNYSVKFSRIPGGMKVVKEQVFHKDIFEVEEFEDFKNFYRRLMDADRMKVAIMRASNR